MERPHSHLFQVEAELPSSGELLTVWLPVWTPGSYLVRVGGTPTASGTYSFTLKIFEKSGCGSGNTDTRTASITISGGVQVTAGSGGAGAGRVPGMTAPHRPTIPASSPIGGCPR